LNPQGGIPVESLHGLAWEAREPKQSPNNASHVPDFLPWTPFAASHFGPNVDSRTRHLAKDGNLLNKWWDDGRFFESILPS